MIGGRFAAILPPHFGVMKAAGEGLPMNIRSFAASLALVSCASPSYAQTVEGPAQLNGAGPVATGAFVGARFRIPLGGARDSDKSLRASLTVAPMQRRDGTGLRGPAWRFGEGLEFGLRGDEAAPRLSFAGQRLGSARYAPGKAPRAKGRSNLSGGGTSPAVIVGLAVLVGGGLLLALGGSDDPDPCTGGECNNN